LPRDVGVIVVAAGRSSRLSGGAAKQYRPVAGVPLVLRAVRPFAAHPEVAHLVLVLPPADAANPPAFLAPHQGKGFTLVAGGAERADSVAAGLAAVRSHCRVILVHDGARPFPARRVIDAVIRYARGGEGAIAALPVTDTIKEGDPTDPTRIGTTVPRSRLWRAQTPQGFPRELLERAYAQAGARASEATDEAALVEACGGTVRLVPDTIRNLKVTTSDDLVLAERLAELEP
jgi:2-C-methyl-D-erythritol 4-phosphate cytidylyltransferase